MAPVDFATIGQLTFMPPDAERFPTIGLAYQALRAGGLMPAVLNAANEVAGQQFYEGQIGFTSIALVIARVMERFHNDRNVTIENVLWADAWARHESLEIVRQAMV